MPQDVAAYYDQTQNHYRRWWKLDRGMSLHYGLWHNDTSSFLEALENTNTYMAELASIKVEDRILDAGCGVGGAAIYLAGKHNAKVTGISLSERQIETAGTNARNHGVNNLVNFKLVDFTRTAFPDEEFDVIWACESSSSAPDKRMMLQEWSRLLKKGGRIVILDFFKTPKAGADNQLLNQWSDLWAMSPLVTLEELRHDINKAGLNLIHDENLTTKIIPTIKFMHRSYLIGRVPSGLYNLFFKAQRYSREHYRSGLLQYKAHRLGLWQYHALLVHKM
jgi:cyclopropane fatty-acyl-phospholipid synthase-like methyltransferase